MPLRQPQLALVLGAIIVVSMLGTIASVVPSLGFRPEGGTIVHEYGLSVVVAPALFAAVVIVAARALSPSRKRLLAAGSTMFGASVLLLGIRGMREPWMDLDDEFVIQAPWALHIFVACAVVLFAVGVALLAYADRLDPDHSDDFAVAHARINSKTP